MASSTKLPKSRSSLSPPEPADSALLRLPEPAALLSLLFRTLTLNSFVALSVLRTTRRHRLDGRNTADAHR